MILSKLTRLGDRGRMWLLIVAVVLASAIVYKAVINPIADKCRDLEQKIQQAQSNLAFNVNVLKQRESVENTYAQIINLIGVPASQAEAIDNIKGVLDEISAATGVNIISMEHREPVPGKSYDTYYIDIGRLQADMQNVLRFIDRIESAPGLLRVTNLNLEPGKDAGGVSGTMLITKVMMPASGGDVSG